MTVSSTLKNKEVQVRPCPNIVDGLRHGIVLNTRVHSYRLGGYK